MSFDNSDAGTAGTSSTPPGVPQQNRHGRFVLAALLLALAGTATVTARAWQEGETPTAPAAAAPTATENAEEVLTVTLVEAEQKKVLRTKAKTAGELLTEQGIKIAGLDRCSVPLTTVLKNGMTVWVARVRKETVVERTPLPFKSEQKFTPELKAGERKVLREGVKGERVVTYTEYYKNGKRTSRDRVSEEVTKPTPQIELVGVRGLSALASRGASVGGRRVVDMVATGYGPGENGPWGNITATGIPTGKGIVAVDPRIIPLGTRLYVEGYGYCLAADTGGAIKGYRIDLGFNSRRQAAAVGRKRVKVIILD